MSRSSQCTMKEIKPVTLSCISSSSQLSKEKKTFGFKGKVRKIGQYIFLLHDIKSYKDVSVKWELYVGVFTERQRIWH